jgi:hypothetical protein
LLSVWHRYFSNLPHWLFSLSVFIVGLSLPITFMMDNISGARIYEAAITGSQFFLVSGFFMAFSALSGEIRTWKIFLTGLFWTLAIGTRQTIVLSISFMALMFTLAIFTKKPGAFFWKLKNILVLIFPLALGIVCLGWYNWTRFGSVTETGLHYQMNRGFVHYHTDKLFGYQYIFQNLFNYFLMPFRVSAKFPFLYPQLGIRDEIVFFSETPSIYGSQVIVGLLVSVPFILFAILPVIMLLFKSKTFFNGEQFLYNWVVINLGGASFVAIGFLSLFFWAAMRYAEDFMPSLIQLSVLGFWQGYSLLADTQCSKVYAWLGGGLAVFSILVSSLIALSINNARFLSH